MLLVVLKCNYLHVSTQSHLAWSCEVSEIRVNAHACRSTDTDTSGCYFFDLDLDSSRIEVDALGQ